MTLGNTGSIGQEDLQFHMKADAIASFFHDLVIFSKTFASDTENVSV